MKIKHYNSKLALVLALTYILWGCSNDDGVNVMFHYASSAFEVSFRTEGTIPAPSITWPEAEGTFALKHDIEGLTIDALTGKIQWERALQLGTQEVKVIAESNGQSWETQFALTNVLSDSFWSGGQNNQLESEDIDFNRLIWLYEDGTLKIELPSNPDSTGVGVWEINGNVVELHFCTYCEGVEPSSVPSIDEHTYYKGMLVNEATKAYIKGQWSVIRFDPDSSTLRGNFYIEWD
ncbi:hypothetical protein MHTCC0001_13300 [Flavobacteriaceae bacterium MHTCC 0001]